MPPQEDAQAYPARDAANVGQACLRTSLQTKGDLCTIAHAC
jgi:hypothetical protein